MQLFKLSSRLSTLGLVLALGLPLKAQSTADAPAPLELGTTSKVTLDQNESAYFKVALPADEIRVTLDTRAADDKEQNLYGSLSILDRDGAVVQANALNFNAAFDDCFRKVAYFSLKKPTVTGFKVTGGNVKAYFWLTVTRKSDARFIPLNGNVVPKPIMVGESKTALLEQAEDAFYSATLPEGDYRAIVELTNPNGQPLNITGFLAFLDGDGGNQETLVSINGDVGVSFRKAGGFTVKKDSMFIFKVRNRTGITMNSLVKVSSGE